ncbi:gliding motility-associated C-terminal domain-containing protein [uncultured Microscilla sp.]|uniref:Ig-like domain-containing protein n=1 Tax=uncultured Microscilla sp. TaxID=432653 RepID=UPI002601F41A|nr:gliding motility-associated C-terminal domain-containing protein [uncultured Microscilla sp.]
MIESKRTWCLLWASTLCLLFCHCLNAQHKTPQLIDALVGPTGSSPEILTAVGNQVIFNGSTTSNGKEVYLSNGTTARSFDISPGGNASGANYFVPLTVQGVTYAYFFATDNQGNGSSVLYRVNIKDNLNDSQVEFVARANPKGGDNGQYLVKMGNELFFSAQDPVGRQELFKNDGTNTTLVKDLNATPIPGGGGITLPSNPKHLTAINGTLFFSADNDPNYDGTNDANRELGISKGDEATTVMFDLHPGGSSNPRYFVEKGGLVYFIAEDNTGTHLWSSDGSNTPPTKIPFPAGITFFNESQRLVVAGGHLFFSATKTTQAGSDYKLWSCDGTNFEEIASVGNPKYMTNMGGTCFFSATGKNSKGLSIGFELWKSDGTSAGTELVKDIASNTFSSSPYNLTVVNTQVNGANKSTLYFWAGISTTKELWKSDGTTSGTEKIVLPKLNSRLSLPDSIVAVEVKPGREGIFFVAVDNDLGEELWYAAPCPSATLNYGSNSICGGSGPISPQLVGADGEDVSAGVYSVDKQGVGLSVDPNTGVITLGGSTPPGDYTIKYEVNQQGCVVEAQVVVKVGTGGGGGGSAPTAKISTLASGFKFDTTIQPENDGSAGVVTSLDGKYLYVADQRNHSIKKIDLATGGVSAVAGSGVAGFKDDNGSLAQFNYPSGLAIDMAGNLYVADKNNHAIRMITNPSGGSPTVSTIAGNSSYPTAVSGNVTGALAVAKFNEPSGVAVDAAGNIYIADKNNHRIKKIANGMVTTFAGPVADGVFAPGRADGAADAARFFFPTSVALDITGTQLYVTDKLNNIIRQINTTNGHTTTYAGDVANGIAGHQDGNAASAQFHSPAGITVNAIGEVYIADTHNQRIRKISQGQVTTIAGTGAEGDESDVLAKDAKFRYPSGVFADLEQNLYISDKLNFAVRKYYLDNANGRVVTGKTICAGTSGTLKLEGLAGSSTIDKWQSSTDGTNWTDITGTANATSINYSNLSVVTFYRALVLSGSCGSDPSNYAILKIGGPAAPVAGQDQTRCGNGSVTVTASGGTDGSYIWYDKDGNVDNAQTNGSYTASFTSGTYTVHVALKGATCESAKVPVKITVSTEPKPVIDPTGAQTVCLGQSQIYQVTTNNTANGNTYKWEVTNGTIVGADDQPQVTVKWETLGTGTLKVTEQNGPTCVGVSAIYNVTINSGTVAPEGVDGSGCGTGGISIQLAAKNATGSMQYLWYDAPAGGNLLKTSADANDGTFNTPSINSTTSYYVSIKSVSCETERVEVVAHVLAGTPNDPTNALTSPQTRCGAGEVTFKAEGAVNGQTYRWYDQATGGKLLQDNAVADFRTGVPLGSTTYYVSIHNTSCGGESNRVAVTVNVTNTGGTPPQVTPRQGCGKSNLVLGATHPDADGSPQFKWYENATDVVPKATNTGSFLVPNLTTTTTYYVSFDNGSCETDKVPVTATITNLTPPQVIDGSRCDAGEVTLTATGATSGQVYRWFLSATPPDASTANWLKSSTDEKDNIYKTPPLGAGRSFYVAVVDINDPDTKSDDCYSSLVEVKAIIKGAGTPPGAPIVRAIPPNLCTAGTFDIEATGATGGQVYKWYADAAKTVLKKTSSDHQDNMYTTDPHTTGTTDYYVSIVDPSCGNAESTLTKVSVSVGGGVADPVPVPGAACGPGKVTLSASGGTEGQYRWYTDLTNATVLSTSATFTTPHIDQSTTYYVSVHNGTCETKRIPVLASVEAAPTASFEGSSLTCVNTEVTYTAASTGLQYTWTVSSEGTITAGGGASDNFVKVRWTTGGLGKVTLEEQVGTCKAQTDKNITLSAKPDVPVVTGDITEVCAYAIGTNNEAVYTISTPNPAYTYVWRIVNGDVAGKIVFTNAEATQVRIRWSNSLPTDIFTETFEVFAQVKNTGCTSDVFTQAVKVKRAPIKPLLTDKVDSVYVNTIRTYATTTNNAGAGITYEWQVTGGAIQNQNANQVTIKWSNTAATRELYVKETVTATGCINYSDTATIYIFPYNVTAKALYPVICEGGQVQLQANDVNAGTYAWYTTANGGAAQYQSTNNGTDSDVLKVPQNTAGLYTYYASPVTLSGVNGADDSGGDNARIAVAFEVKANNPANFTVVGDTTNAQNCTPNGAGGGAVTLTTVSGGFAGAPYTYLWSKTGEAAYSATTRDISDLTPGTYTVQVTDAGGCMSDVYTFVIEDKRQYVTDAKLNITSTGSLVLNAASDTATITVGESVILTATATDAATFAWTANTSAEVANISDLTAGSPTLTPSQTTSYTVQLANSKGCDTTLTMVVRVLRFQVFVPSMFTPNNDQKNDRFQVFGNQVATLSLKVYSRTGLLVYESNSKEEVMGSDEFGAKTGETQNNGWDGTYKQRPLPKGNYVWYLRGKYKNGVEFKESGNVLLIR